MENIGIICEYNPIHRGHLRHIAQSLDSLGICGVVCLMSGGFVQRGEPAVFSKLSRAEAAIRRDGEPGADLVLELPVTGAISSAEGFARTGIELLNSLGCIDYLSFGSECGRLNAIQETAQILLDGGLRDRLKPYLDIGLSFATARQRAVEEIDPAAAGILVSPNNILAVEYVKALIQTSSKIQPFTVQRVGAAHDSGEGDELPSASRIRQLILSGGDWQSLVPSGAAEIFQGELESGCAPYTLQNAERAVLYRLRTMKNEDFDALPFGGEGLNIRLQANARQFGSVEEIIEATKTKRYAHSRIRRMVLCAFLGMTGEDMKLPAPYARVLAFNDRGRDILKSCKSQVLTNPGQIRKLDEAAQSYFQMECRCADLLSLCLPNDGEPKTGNQWRENPKYVW